MKSFLELKNHLNSQLNALTLETEADLTPILSLLQSTGVIIKEKFQEEIFSLAFEVNLFGIRETELLEVIKQINLGPDYLEIWTKENVLYKRKPQDVVQILNKANLKKEDYALFLSYLSLPEQNLNFQIIHILMK